MNKFWGSNVQHCDYSKHHCIVHMKIAKSIDLKCSQHKKDVIIILCDEVKQHCCKGFPGGSNCEESTCNIGDPGFIPGQNDPLEKGMATHSSILAWRIPWTEEPGKLQFMGPQESDTTEWLSLTVVIRLQHASGSNRQGACILSGFLCVRLFVTPYLGIHLTKYNTYLCGKLQIADEKNDDPNICMFLLC